MTMEGVLRRRRWFGLALTYAMGFVSALALVTVASRVESPPDLFTGKYRLPVVGGFERQWPGAWRSQEPTEKRVPFGFHNGALTIYLANRTPTPAYNGVQSTLRWDFTGRAAAIRAEYGRLHVKPGVDMKFRVTQDHHKGFAAIQVGQGLQMRHQYGDQFWERTVPYDPVAHRWFRIRHVTADDTIRWELSPDGQHWTEYARDKRRFDISRVKMEIYGGTYMPVESPGMAMFNHFSLKRDSAPPVAVSNAAVITDGGVVR